MNLVEDHCYNYVGHHKKKFQCGSTSIAESILVVILNFQVNGALPFLG